VRNHRASGNASGEMAREKIFANAELFCYDDGIKRARVLLHTQLVALAALLGERFLKPRRGKRYEDEISAIRQEYVFPGKDAEKSAESSAPSQTVAIFHAHTASRITT